MYSKKASSYNKLIYLVFSRWHDPETTWDEKSWQIAYSLNKKLHIINTLDEKRKITIFFQQHDKHFLRLMQMKMAIRKPTITEIGIVRQFRILTR